MKVSIANVFTKNGNLEYNYNLFEKYYFEAVENSVDLIIFSRLFLSGINNDFSNIEFINNSIKFLEKVISLTENQNTAIIMGGIYYLESYTKNEINYDSITNDSAFFIKNGYLEEIVSRKEYSKNNEFNDYKFFDKSLYLKNFEYKYKKFSIFLSDDIYHDENIFLLKSQNTDYLICLDSTRKDSEIIKNRLIKVSKFFRKPIIYLNNTTYFDNEFINGDVFLIDEKQNAILSNNYKIDTLHNFYLDYEDGSEIYTSNILNDTSNNKHNLLNKLSEIENKKILFINEKNDSLYKLVKNSENKNINFNEYCNLYNNFNNEEKSKFEKIVLNNLFNKNYIAYYNPNHA